MRRLKFDKDSPRFKEAQLSLGFNDEDLTYKRMSYFQDEEAVDRKVIQLRHQHHLFKLRDDLNMVIEKRLKIKQERGQRASIVNEDIPYFND